MPRKQSTDNDLSSFTINTEEEVPKAHRGRTVDPFVLAIRDQLLASQSDGKARSFVNVEAGEQRTELGNKVRAAAKAIGSDFKVKTIYVPDEKKVYFGPTAVVDALSGKSTQMQESNVA